jgi:G6PDH family F420-dependent oxidoreductase
VGRTGRRRADRAGGVRRTVGRTVRTVGRSPHRGRARWELVSGWSKARPAGLARAIGQIPICWAPDRQQAIDLAHEQFRWFGGGWYVNADLPTPAGFDAAGQFVRKEDVAGSIACGPDLDELAESVRPYLQAGFTDVALVQVGDALQQEFLDKAAGPLLDKLRALAP